jgi:hypothetical protein
MKIEITWNRPDGSNPAVGFAVNANDPHKDDEELQVTKAKTAAQAHFHQKFGSAPPLNQLSIQVIKE